MSLVKSKQRVADHGEVFTPRWLVEDMLNLVQAETERIDSRFLESFMSRRIQTRANYDCDYSVNKSVGKSSCASSWRMDAQLIETATMKEEVAH